MLSSRCCNIKGRGTVTLHSCPNPRLSRKAFLKLGMLAAAATLSPATAATLVVGGTALSHGRDLTRALVGPEGLGVEPGRLRETSVNGERVGTWPGTSIPSWIPRTPFISNNSPNNHGGIVPSGGMVIDGFEIPAGAWVSQFNEFDDQIIIYGNSNGQSPDFPGIVFRGCRWRGNMVAPGYLNVYKNSNTNIWVTHCDAGGRGPADSQLNEVAFSLNDETSNSFFYRNYVSYVATGIQPGTRSAQLVENLVEKVTFFFNGAPPPGAQTGLHLNGISLNGMQANALLLRNKVFLQSPDEAGRRIDQTDCIAFFQDAGPFFGNGTNIDGSAGYLVKDNYLGGGGYCIYAGMNEGKPRTSVRNMVLIGNQVTTQWWPRGGRFGPLGAEPLWNSYGNVKNDNTFAESGAAW
jgi:hypothetical protein